LPFLAAALAASTPARAAGLPLLVVHRTEDALGCPDARSLAALVAELMKAPALQPAPEGTREADRALDVQIYKSEKGYTAVIRAKGKTRQLSDDGANCRSLAAALAVSISVLLDNDPLPSAPEPPAPPPEPPAPPPEPQPPPKHPLSTTTWDSETEAPVVEEPPIRPRIVVSAAPVITVGLLQSWAGAVTSELEVRLGRFSVAGGVLVLPGQTIPFDVGQLNLDLTLGLLRGCAAVADKAYLRLALCAGPIAGAIRGETRGFSGDRTSTYPWVAAGVSAHFEQRIWGPLYWGARAELVIPLDKWQFTVDNKVAYNPASAGGAWDAELRVSIW
jgi:hypothetical protein